VCSAESTADTTSAREKANASSRRCRSRGNTARV
jgi:hypothetical protein